MNHRINVSISLIISITFFLQSISFPSYVSTPFSFQYLVSEPLVQVVIRGKGDAESHMYTRSVEFTHNALEFELDGCSKD